MLEMRANMMAAPMPARPELPTPVYDASRDDAAAARSPPTAAHIIARRQAGAIRLSMMHAKPRFTDSTPTIEPLQSSSVDIMLNNRRNYIHGQRAKQHESPCLFSPPQYAHGRHNSFSYISNASYVYTSNYHTPPARSILPAAGLGRMADCFRLD